MAEEEKAVGKERFRCAVAALNPGGDGPGAAARPLPGAGTARGGGKALGARGPLHPRCLRVGDSERRKDSGQGCLSNVKLRKCRHCVLFLLPTLMMAARDTRPFHSHNHIKQ